MVFLRFGWNGAAVQFNRFDQLELIASNAELAVKMEVQRSTPPAPGLKST